MAASYEVHPYSIDTLRKLLAEKARAEGSVISSKNHCFYFESYFKELAAKTIVVENDYVDRDFLEDFAAYYVRCHHPYDRRCTRLHFFSEAFSAMEFESLLKAGSANPLLKCIKQAYLGFVVVKPLPQTVVGRTCLSTYGDAGGRRCYPITRSYHANLFGIELSVNSLAFQEQDSVVAACATSALWSAFHGTGMLFQHAVLSPVEITRAASTNFANRSRNLPNRGLTPEQMALAVRSVGLEPFVINASDDFVFRSTLYAYLSGHIPALVLGSLYDTACDPVRHLGLHAVAATGFSCDTEKAGDAGPAGFLSRACCMDHIYAHDDQVGPFARMVFDGITVDATHEQRKEAWSLSTSWRAATGDTATVRFVPEMLLVPLYHKIRIPLDVVQAAIISCDRFFELLRIERLVPSLSERLRWDVRLTTVGDYKTDVFQDSSLAPNLRHEVLGKAMPRFLWRATARCGERSVMDLLFDATDIEQGGCFVQAVKIDAQFAQILQGVLAIPGLDSLLTSLPHPARVALNQFK